MTKIKYLFAGLVVAAVVAAPVAANATASQGHGHTPVTVCHNGNTLTVDDNALRAHLAHGDTEGSCQGSTPTSPTGNTSSPTAPIKEHPQTTPPVPSSTATNPTSTPGTPTPESPVEPSQPTVPEATSPTTVAPQPSAGTTPTTSPNYTTALFEIQGGDWTKPQKFIAAIPGATLTGFGNLLKCGTDYQVDIYKPLADGTKPDVLWETGYLLYAHDGPFLAYDLPYTPYKLFTTDDCEVIPSPSTPPQTVSPTPPSQPTAGVPSSQPTTGPSIAPSPSTPSQAGVSAPRTVSPVTSSTTAPATAKPATNSLAMTGSDSWKYAVAAALLTILIGAFAVYDARKYRKFKRNNPFK